VKYKTIRVNGKKIDEHRYIWQAEHGDIPEGYCIHHIDGDGMNSDVSNLQLVTYSEHNRIHKSWKNFGDTPIRFKIGNIPPNRQFSNEAVVSIKYIILNRGKLSLRKLSEAISINVNTLKDISCGRWYYNI